MKKIQRKEILFELTKVRIVKKEEEEWIEIEVKVTDENGERIQIVREGDVLTAIFEAEIIE